MSYVIDTDVCSAFLKGNGNVFGQFVQHGGGLYISTITLGELYSWVLRTRTSPRHRDALDAMLQDVSILPVTFEVASRFGSERASLLDRGITIPTADLFIACTALHHGFTVVTHNTAHFRRVPRLRLEDWC